MKKIIILSFLLLQAVLLYAQTEVQGDVSGTWTAANSPYNVIGDIIVPNGQTLTINPGVSVQFMDRCSLTIHGTFTVVGTESASIFFTSGKSSPKSNSWSGITFESDSDPNSVISYSEIEYSINSITCDAFSNLFINPLFVDAANFDFHLLVNSPCIDAGNPKAEYFDTKHLAEFTYKLNRRSFGTIMFDKLLIASVAFS